MLHCLNLILDGCSKPLYSTGWNNFGCRFTFLNTYCEFPVPFTIFLFRSFGAEPSKDAVMGGIQDCCHLCILLVSEGPSSSMVTGHRISQQLFYIVGILLWFSLISSSL